MNLDLANIATMSPKGFANASARKSSVDKTFEKVLGNTPEPSKSARPKPVQTQSAKSKPVPKRQERAEVRTQSSTKGKDPQPMDKPTVQGKVQSPSGEQANSAGNPDAPQEDVEYQSAKTPAQPVVSPLKKLAGGLKASDVGEGEVSKDGDPNAIISPLAGLQPLQTPVSQGEVAFEGQAPQGSAVLGGEAVLQQTDVNSDQVAMLKFMDSLESELGIPREKFVEAMVTVSNQQPSSSASQTVEGVIQQLELPPEEAQQAKAMYSDMIVEIETNEDESPMVMTGEGKKGEGRASKDAMMLSAAKTPESRQTIDDMNNRFFLREGVPLGSFRHPGQVVEENPEPIAFGQNRPIVEQVQVTPPAPQLEVDTGSVTKDTSSAEMPFSMSTQQSFSQDTSDESSSDQQQQLATPFVANVATKTESKTDVKPFQLQTLMNDPKQIEVGDVGKFTARAQSLARQGGGEVKMLLQPEGLGHVRMTVSVQNGEVNVELMTETNEARQILEKSIGDLRGSLAQQRLNVDDIKVALSEGTSGQDFLGKQDEADQQMQRDLARGFLEEFRNSNHGFREEMIGVQGLRNYERVNGETPDVDPIRSSSNEVQQERGKGRSLNLVA